MGEPANPVVPNADTQVRWQQLGELFDRVCELDPTSRDSLLAAEMLDPDLEAQLSRMLAANDRPSVLDAPPLPGVLQQVFVEPRALADGELLLDLFEIIRLINRGGMDEVYEAIAGIVHRDLKPTNIMLCPYRVVITDCGLARSITPGDHSLSASKSAHGQEHESAAVKE